MNGVAALLCLGLVVASVWMGLQWLLRQPAFAIRAITVEGDVARNSSASLRANALPRLAGSFVSMNLQNVRQAFEAVPWVRQASVQRIWPRRLLVRLEEHRPAAYWEAKPEGADAQSDAVLERRLVNSFGEVFEANLGDVEDEELPVLAGPEGSAATMLAMWRQLQATSRQQLGEGVSRLDLSGRGSWRATLDKGAQLELGRGEPAEVQARYAQFAASITQVASRYQSTLVSADLRHEQGYAVKLAGVTTVSTAPKGVTKKN
jgi:cell division protein FtsQ